MGAVEDPYIHGVLVGACWGALIVAAPAGWYCIQMYRLQRETLRGWRATLKDWQAWINSQADQ